MKLASRFPARSLRDHVARGSGREWGSPTGRGTRDSSGPWRESVPAHLSFNADALDKAHRLRIVHRDLTPPGNRTSILSDSTASQASFW